MKLHANAALSLNKRGVLARRVVEMDWSLTKAAEAAEVSERTARKWASGKSAFQALQCVGAQCPLGMRPAR